MTTTVDAFSAVYLAFVVTSAIAAPNPKTLSTRTELVKRCVILPSPQRTPSPSFLSSSHVLAEVAVRQARALRQYKTVTPLFRAMINALGEPVLWARRETGISCGNMGVMVAHDTK